EPDPSTYIFGPKTIRATRELDHGLFIKNQMSLFERWDLQMGARADHYRRTQRNLTSGNSSKVSDGAISPSVGLLYHLHKSPTSDTGLYANWGRGFSPIFRGVTSTEIVTVDPETSRSLEAGIKTLLYNGLLEGTLALYRLDRTNVVGLNAA